MDSLRLAALDAEDLAILSAHTQDAVVLTGECRFLPREKRFVVTMNRFVWEKAPPRGLFRFKSTYERRRSVLHFDRVLAVKRTGLSMSDPDEVLALLSLRWAETQAPSGTIDLVFAGGAAIRLDVECIEAQLADLGARWSTDARPDHRV
ncbi:MAG: DUF2948 family protein [Methylobacterium sp.]